MMRSKYTGADSGLDSSHGSSQFPGVRVVCWPPGQDPARRCCPGQLGGHLLDVAQLAGHQQARGRIEMKLRFANDESAGPLAQRSRRVEVCPSD